MSYTALFGGVVCFWGRGEDGQLGHGDAEDRMLPTQLSDVDEIASVIVTCGADHTTAFSESTSQLVMGLRIKQIACGDSRCLAVTMEGEVQRIGAYACLCLIGWSKGGQLGHGDFEDCLIPHRLEALSDKFISQMKENMNALDVIPLLIPDVTEMIEALRQNKPKNPLSYR